MMQEETSRFDYLPNEVLVRIFKWLDLKTLMICHAMCLKWEQIIKEHILNNEKEWRRFCLTDYKDIYLSAFRNSIPPGLKWSQLYRTLSLWEQLPQARQTKTNFSVARTEEDKILNFQILCDGIIGVLKIKGIIYYDVDIIQHSHEFLLTDSYIKYTETDEIIFLLNSKKHLCLVRKGITDEIEPSVSDVSFFIVLDDAVYCVTVFDFLCRYILVDGTLVETNMVRIFNTVLALGYENDTLHILTRDLKILAFVNDELITVLQDGSYRDILQSLNKYQFSNNIDWENFLFSLKHTYQEIEHIPLMKNLGIIQTHGPVLFAGYKNGLLRIFYSLYTTSVVDLLISEPIRECYLIEVSENRPRCTILNIDVVEGEDSHTVIVAMSHKMIAIKFDHPPTTTRKRSLVESLPSCSQSASKEESPGSSYEQLLFVSGDQSMSSIGRTLNLDEPSSSRREQSTDSSSAPVQIIISESSNGSEMPSNASEIPSSASEMPSNASEMQFNDGATPSRNSGDESNSDGEPSSKHSRGPD